MRSPEGQYTIDFDDQNVSQDVPGETLGNLREEYGTPFYCPSCKEVQGHSGACSECLDSNSHQTVIPLNESTISDYIKSR